MKKQFLLRENGDMSVGIFPSKHRITLEIDYKLDAEDAQEFENAAAEFFAEYFDTLCLTEKELMEEQRYFDQLCKDYEEEAKLDEQLFLAQEKKEGSE